jgi:hypothetical protein
MLNLLTGASSFTARRKHARPLQDALRDRPDWATGRSGNRVGRRGRPPLQPGARIRSNGSKLVHRNGLRGHDNALTSTISWARHVPTHTWARPLGCGCGAGGMRRGIAQRQKHRHAHNHGSSIRPGGGRRRQRHGLCTVRVRLEAGLPRAPDRRRRSGRGRSGRRVPAPFHIHAQRRLGRSHRTVSHLSRRLATESTIRRLARQWVDVSAVCGPSRSAAMSILSRVLACGAVLEPDDCRTAVAVWRASRRSVEPRRRRAGAPAEDPALW